MLIMSKNVEVGLGEWRNASSDELGYTGPQLETNEYRYTAKNGQAFNVFVADARPDGVGPTYLTSTQYDYRMDDLLRRGSSIFATQTGSRVAVSEIPGITFDPETPFRTKGAWQTPYQSLRALSGDYGPLALTVLEGLDAGLHFKDGDEVQIGGRSLAAKIGEGILDSLARHKFSKDLKVSRVDLVEPVSGFGNLSVSRQWKILQELSGYEENMRIDVYIPENEQIGHPGVRFEDQSELNDRILKHVRRTQFPAMYATGMGQRNGLGSILARAMADKTNDGIGLHEAEITVAYGDASRVSFEKDIVAAREVVRQIGGDVKILKLTDEKGSNTPIAHHALDSFARMASYAQQRNSNFSA